MRRVLAILFVSFEADLARLRPGGLIEPDEALVRLARWCMRYSPISCVEPSPGPPAVVVDITGCERLHGSESRLLRRAWREIAAKGLAARLATASTPAAALAACRAPEERTELPPGAGCRALARVPMDALRLPPETLVSLAEVNLRRIGDLEALPREDLALRFGPALLARMDLVDGRLAQALVPVRENPPPSIEMPFEGPTCHVESLHMALRQSLEALCARLHGAERGVRELESLFLRAGAPPESIRTRLGMPSASAAHIWRLLLPSVERLQMAFGVEGIRLTALRTGRLMRVQGAFGGAESVPEGGRLLAECMDVVGARLGPRRIRRSESMARYEPELAYRLVAWGSRCPARIEPLTALRPTVLLPAPRPIGVRSAPSGAPASVCVRARWQEVAEAVGPERICEGWWEGGAAGTRDYWRIRCAGGDWLWAFAREGAWFLHGTWA